MYYVKADDNVKIAVYDLNAACPKTILMIHGWPLSAKMFEYQQEFLTTHGYRVVTIDLRGFGNSDVRACGYTYNQMASDVNQVVRALKLNNFVLLGFSMGGAIAARYMARYHGYGVKKLCLCAAALPSFTQRPGIPFGKSRQEANALINLAKEDRPQLCENFSRELLYSPHSDAVRDWFRLLALSASGIATIRCGYSLRDEDSRSDLPKIHVPTGIFHGKQDDIVPYALAEMTHEFIPHSVLYPFENSSHGIVYDELQIFNHTLLEFLNCPLKKTA